MRNDLLAVAKKCDALWIFPNSIEGSTEIRGFTLRREDILEKEIANTSRQDQANYHETKIEGLLRGARRFLAYRELMPWNITVVIEWRDSPPPGGSRIIP